LEPVLLPPPVPVAWLAKPERLAPWKSQLAWALMQLPLPGRPVLS
jgi:hypothetical protein